MARKEKSWELSDEFWALVAPHIPVRPKKTLENYFARKPGGGRKPADPRKVFAAILYILRTGMQWNALPREKFGIAGSSVHKYFMFWIEKGFFETIWREGLAHYDEVVGILWEWQSADGASLKAPLAQEDVGPNPTDRAKAGTKRHLLVDERGVPLGLVITGANTHDSVVLPKLLDSKRIDSPLGQKENLCLDAAYVGNPVDAAARARNYTPHVRPRGEEARDIQRKEGAKPRRWIVEVGHSWFTRFRKLLVRFEKKSSTYLALTQLAATAICFRKTIAEPS